MPYKNRPFTEPTTFRSSLPAFVFRDRVAPLLGGHSRPVGAGLNDPDVAHLLGRLGTQVGLLANLFKILHAHLLNHLSSHILTLFIIDVLALVLVHWDVHQVGSLTKFYFIVFFTLNSLCSNQTHYRDIPNGGVLVSL